MKSQNLTEKKGIQLVLFGLLLPVLAIPFIIQATHTSVPIFDLHFNPYALLSAASLLACLVFLTIAWIYKLRSQEAVWTVAYITGLTIFAGGEMLQRLSLTPSGAIFWAQVSAVGVEFIGPAAFLFALSYSRPNARHTGTTSLLLFGAAIIAFFQVNGPLIFSNTVATTQSHPWGFDNPVGPAFIANALWIYIPLVLSLVLIFRFRRRTANKTLRAQAAIYLFGVSVPVAGAIITNTLLPLLNNNNVIPLATLFATITGASLIYGVTRYKFFEFSPAVLSQNILSTMHESVIVTNTQLEIEFINNEAERLLGASTNTVAHKLLESYFDRPLSINLQKTANDMETTRQVIRGLTITRPGQETTFIRISISKVIENQKTQGYIFVITDITELHKSYELIEKEKESVERKVAERTLELKQEHARLDASINSLNVGFFMTDNESKLMTINRSAKRILSKLNTPPQDTSQETWSIGSIHNRLVSGIDIQEHIKQCLTAKKSMEFLSVDYGNLILRILLAPILTKDVNSGEMTVLGGVVLIEDVTEEKVLARSKDEFFIIASHELRTPLARISGALEVIKSSYSKDFDNRLDEMLETIRSSNTQLERVVNELLQVSELEQNTATKSNKKVFSIEPIVTDVLHDFSKDAQSKGIYLRAQSDLKDLPSVLANPINITQVLSNLIENALASTTRGGIIVSAQVDSKDQLKVSVRDTGIGISTENQQLLFHKFQQASDNLLVHNSGVGLGLYIAQLLIHNNNGTIQLEKSTKDKGSTFSFTLPLTRSN